MAAYKSVRKQRMTILAVYVLALFSIWAVYQLRLFAGLYNNNAVLGSIIENSIKYIVWTLPVFILLRYVYISNPFAYLKLEDNFINGVMWGTIIGFALTVYHIVRFFFMGDGTLKLDIDIYTWIHRILLIGLTEEVVFRGFILQKLNEELEFVFANGIAAVLFMLIHFPGWYVGGLMSDGNVMYFYMSAAFVLAFGLLQGYVLKRTKSLWACMIIHSINNLITTVIGI